MPCAPNPLQFKLARVFRDLQLRQSIENSIHQKLESLKYSLENPPAILIDWLDRAIPSGHAIRPSPLYIVVAAGVGSLVIGILLTFILEYIKQLKDLDRRKQQIAHSQL